MIMASCPKVPLASSSLFSSSSSSSFSFFLYRQHYKFSYNGEFRARIGNFCLSNFSSTTSGLRKRRKTCLSAGKEDTELNVEDPEQDEDEEEEEEEEEVPPTPQDLEYVGEIKRVLELLRKNRDMLFSEVKLTIMIEDPREVERRRLLGIEDPDAPTRDDLVEALEQVNEGKVPKNRIALRMLAEEMINWPNLEVETPKKSARKSLYAKATDTGINPQEAAKRVTMDWDSAADIEEADVNNDTEVPPVVVSMPLFIKFKTDNSLGRSYQSSFDVSVSFNRYKQS
ncbi:hypothetical protein K2173_020515 [Erythroxylum novogranatense]|uniref:Ycf3-interacting protein 1, chloroplastic n=1 Tax=Erythroxylum novogranatense TaxID=1862640 RepID=A0AAV8TII7_9ROSI|nr:hypothetical protein K2173_020515 [Erythroxylum novogranatense]